MWCNIEDFSDVFEKFLELIVAELICNFFKANSKTVCPRCSLVWRIANFAKRNQSRAKFQMNLLVQQVIESSVSTQVFYFSTRVFTSLLTSPFFKITKRISEIQATMLRSCGFWSRKYSVKTHSTFLQKLAHIADT